MTHNARSITSTSLIRQWLVQLALNVPVRPIPYSRKCFSKARDVKILSNVTLNENPVGN